MQVGIRLDEIINSIILYKNGFEEMIFHESGFRELQSSMKINIDEPLKELV